MFTLATDVQKIIMEFLEPKEIKVFYESCEVSKVMFEELTKHTNFAVDCKRIMPDEELQWFKFRNIRLKLLEKYEYDSKYNAHIWYKNGNYHRDNDLPAIIFDNGTQVWYQNDVRHRDNDLPAVITLAGDKKWYKNGKLHRDNDLPAVIFLNYTQRWYQNGVKHRDNDLPATILANGTQYWYKNGLMHRDNDLPAVIEANGDQYWYQNGRQYVPK